MQKIQNSHKKKILTEELEEVLIKNYIEAQSEEIC